MKVERRIPGQYLRKDGPGVPLVVTFTWESDDPLAVTLEFPQEAQSIHWVISRDILHRGLTQSSGDLSGDVAVWPSEHSRMVLSLRPPHGRADIDLPVFGVDRFLEDTFAHTPIGAESARIEAAIENFIDSIRERGA